MQDTGRLVLSELSNNIKNSLTIDGVDQQHTPVSILPFATDSYALFHVNPADTLATKYKYVLNANNLYKVDDGTNATKLIASYVSNINVIDTNSGVSYIIQVTITENGTTKTFTTNVSLINRGL